MLDRRERLALLPLGDAHADGLLVSVAPSERGECWWLVLRSGTPLRGDGGAGVALLSEIHATRHLGAALGRLRLSLAVDALDRLVSRHRRRLGRLVPDGPAPRRYP